MTVDCAITAVAEVAQAKALGHGGGRHRPPRAPRRRRAARRPDRASRGLRLPVPRSLRHGRRLQARPGARARRRRAGATAARAGCGPRGTARARRRALEEDLDLVALATIADVVSLTGENRTLVRRGLRALAGTAKPGLRALMSVARVDPGKLTERSVAFALAPRLNAAGRLYRADAGLELILTEDPLRAAQVAEELDRANHERRAGRDAHPLRSRSADRGIGSRPPALRLRARGRGLARGRDRDRRLAAGRAPPPPGRADRPRRGYRQGLGAQHRRVRPARGPDRLRRAPAPLRRPPRRRRPGDRARARGGVRAGVRRARRGGARPGRHGAAGARRRHRGSASSSGWSSPRSCSRWRRSGAATPASRCSCRTPRFATCARWGRASTCASRSSPAARAQRAASPSDRLPPARRRGRAGRSDVHAGDQRVERRQRAPPGAAPGAAARERARRRAAGRDAGERPSRTEELMLFA